MAIHIQNRSDLIDSIEKHELYPCIRRAISDDGIEILGKFKKMKNINQSVILARVRSRFDRVWIIALAVIPKPRVLICQEEDIDWSTWLGDEHPNSFLAGDRPNIYRKLKNEDTNRENDKSD